MDQEQLREVYEMVDGIPLTRAKRNIGRDFADGVMMAEVIHHYRPKLVSLHNYPSANSLSKKMTNWETLNTKVLKKLGLSLSKFEIQDIVNSVPYAIEHYLYRVLIKLQHPEQQIKIQQVRRETTQPYREPQDYSAKKEEIAEKIAINQSQQISELIDQIEHSYDQLQKLQDISKLKDDVIRSLEKKVEKQLSS